MYLSNSKFVSVNISHFFDFWFCLIVIDFTRHFKGHLEILASALYHKSHNHDESHRQRSIFSNDIGIAKISFFSCKLFCRRNRTSIWYTSIFFLLSSMNIFSSINSISMLSINSFSINITLIQLIICLQLPTHPFRGIHCSRQKDVWLLEALIH